MRPPDRDCPAPTRIGMKARVSPTKECANESGGRLVALRNRLVSGTTLLPAVPIAAGSPLQFGAAAEQYCVLARTPLDWTEVQPIRDPEEVVVRGTPLLTFPCRPASTAAWIVRKSPAPDSSTTITVPCATVGIGEFGSRATRPGTAGKRTISRASRAARAGAPRVPRSCPRHKVRRCDPDTSACAAHHGGNGRVPTIRPKRPRPFCGKCARCGHGRRLRGPQRASQSGDTWNIQGWDGDCNSQAAPQAGSPGAVTSRQPVGWGGSVSCSPQGDTMVS